MLSTIRSLMWCACRHTHGLAPAAICADDSTMQSRQLKKCSHTPGSPLQVATMKELEVPMLMRLASFVAYIVMRRPAVMRAMTPKQLEFVHTIAAVLDNSFYLTLDLCVLRRTGRVTTYPLQFSVVHSCSLFASLWSGLLRVRPVMVQLASRLLAVIAVPLATGCWKVLLHPSNLVQSLSIVYLMLRAPWCDARLREKFAKIVATQRLAAGAADARGEALSRSDSGRRRRS